VWKEGRNANKSTGPALTNRTDPASPAPSGGDPQRAAAPVHGALPTATGLYSEPHHGRTMARTLDRTVATRLAALVGAGTLVLTAIFVGLVALVNGGTPGFDARLPVYVLAMAVAFVGGLVLVEVRHEAGPTGAPRS
jgi:hypothetical protein